MEESLYDRNTGRKLENQFGQYNKKECIEKRGFLYFFLAQIYKL